jgi:RNA polymerase sigma factor (sigma-70 family)
MDEENPLAGQFEASRPHLEAVAYRILGTRAEAEDAVQEAWLRLSRSDTSDVGNLRGWLTTVVGRICLDMLRSRRLRKEEGLDAHDPEAIPSAAPAVDDDMALADSVGLALLVVLETLTPAERVAFVLHDMFDLPFDEIAPIIGRSLDATRQLASRARRRVQGKAEPTGDDRDRRREIVGAFLAASRGGDFAALLAVLDPDVVFHADPAAVAASLAGRAAGAPEFRPEIRGADAVAGTFVGRARAAQVALIDGEPGLVYAPGGVPRAAFLFTTQGGRIVGLEIVADPERLGKLEIAVSDNPLN